MNVYYQTTATLPRDAAGGVSLPPGLTHFHLLTADLDAAIAASATRLAAAAVMRRDTIGRR